ncbi:MAG: hypothetical protein RLZZ303_1334 [Candidatus Hydrogenedentota bacterium]
MQGGVAKLALASFSVGVWAGRGGMPYRLACFFAAMSAAILTACGTTGAPASSPLGRNSNAQPGLATRSGDVAEARRLIESGAFSQAIPRLLLVTSQDSASPQAAEAFYWMGVAYHRIGSLAEATDAYGRSLEAAPEGPFAMAAKTAMDTIGTEVDAAFVDENELDAMIAQVEERVKREPNESAHRLLLADLNWKRGNYDAAGTLYRELLRDFPGLARDKVVTQRMQQQADGGWTTMTPERAIQEDTEKNPLVLYGVSSYTSRELRGDLRYYYVDFYHVSGYVVNQSRAVVRNVFVDVTIYGFGGQIFDTQSINIGQLKPNQRRTFAVRFNNFDDVNNVQRYDCQLRYEN